MKQSITLFVCSVLLVGSLAAQDLVSVLAGPKNVVLEEFTGTSCPFCPDGHVIAKALRTQYPEDVWVIGYHPTNTTLTTPRSASDPDFRRTFPNAFFNEIFMLTSPSMPSAFINRRSYGIQDPTRGQNRGLWSNYARAITRQTAPVNIGMEAYYDTAFHEIVVNVEAYFTSATNEQLIYVVLMEDSLIAGQSGGAGNYVHNHVFRETLTTGQWGDSINTNPVAGQLYKNTFTYSNTDLKYNWKHLSVVAFLRDAVTEEISNGAGIEGVELLKTTTGLPNGAKINDVQVFPNPASDLATLKFTTTTSGPVTAVVYDAIGKEVTSVDFGVRSAGTQRLNVNIAALQTGMYTVHVLAGEKRGTQRLIKK